MRIAKAKVKAAVALLLGASGALSCHLRAEKNVAVLGQPFVVTIGKSTEIPAQKLNVSFERLTEDSRCPKGVDCVWPGQISVVVGLKKANKKLGTAQLILQGGRTITPKSIGKIGGYYVKLIQAAPEREMSSAGTAQRIRLVVQSQPFAAPKSGK